LLVKGPRLLLRDRIGRVGQGESDGSHGENDTDGLCMRILP
jgi:hypothetical protein